jgi:sRNA-binding protein
MRRRRLRKQKPPKRRAAAKAAKETEKADAVEKALQEEANERNHAFDNEKRSDLENMKAGAKHVGSNIYIPKDAVHFKDGGVSALFVESNGDEGSLVHGHSRLRQPLEPSGCS